jgi:acid stress-induced BolA-like protein IbaG/YrbA
MGKIITIDGVDYDAEGFGKYLNGLDPVKRDQTIKDIINQMVETDPEEAVKVFRAALRKKVN